MRFRAGYTRLRLALLMATTVLVAGCATTKAFTPPQLPGNGLALVYFIRDGFGDGDGEAKVFINNVQVATLANDDFVAVNVSMGVNYVEIGLHHKPPVDFTLRVGHPEKIYVSVNSTDKLLGVGADGSRNVVMHSRHVEMHRISELSAQDWAARAHKDISWKASSS